MDFQTRRGRLRIRAAGVLAIAGCVALLGAWAYSELYISNARQLCSLLLVLGCIFVGATGLLLIATSPIHQKS